MTCEIKGGEFRHRIAIQAPTESAGPLGEVTQAWATAITVWGSIAPLRGSEKVQGEQVTAEATHMVKMRYNSTVTPAHRLLFGSRTFDINHIANVDELNKLLEITCTEAVD
jgi:SPP1 family predicted phage head-tail adaptor